ncbi:MAG: 5'-deoxyadenosine deaminase [Acidobacteriota bacterium]
MSSVLIRGGTVLTMNGAGEIVTGDVSLRDGRIAAIGGRLDDAHDSVIEASGALVLPGFVQTHLHLCQTLFRGMADDLRLIDWLRLRVWPLEAAHTPASLRASARLAAVELLSTGTTTALTMETVHDTDVIFDAVAATGMRATIGKCMMDADAQVPARLLENTRTSIDESVDIQRRWHGQANGRIRAAFAPRFAVSCSRDLLEAVAALSSSGQSLVHTHASEQQEEIGIVERLTGRRNLEYFADIGLTSPRLCLAHCVWVDDGEQALMAEHGVKVLHCPGSNLKLGSGLAPIPELRARGICVSLGADGAACNNRLDMFEEMRLAAVIQAVRKGPGVLTARDVVAMATRGGAQAIGLQDDIGSIELGKRADVIVVDVSRPHTTPGSDPYSTLVYAARGTDVRATIVDGHILVRDFVPVHLDPVEIAADARDAAKALVSRAGI